jgi:hypothetical protein
MSFLLAHEVPYRLTAMSGQAVPDDQQLAGEVTLQMLQELDDLRGCGWLPETAGSRSSTT